MVYGVPCKTAPYRIVQATLKHALQRMMEMLITAEVRMVPGLMQKPLQRHGIGEFTALPEATMKGIEVALKPGG
jgi:hypothetical protein